MKLSNLCKNLLHTICLHLDRCDICNLLECNHTFHQKISQETFWKLWFNFRNINISNQTYTDLSHNYNTLFIHDKNGVQEIMKGVKQFTLSTYHTFVPIIYFICFDNIVYKWSNDQITKVKTNIKTYYIDDLFEYWLDLNSCLYFRYIFSKPILISINVLDFRVTGEKDCIYINHNNHIHLIFRNGKRKTLSTNGKQIFTSGKYTFFTNANNILHKVSDKTIPIFDNTRSVMCKALTLYIIRTDGTLCFLPFDKPITQLSDLVFSHFDHSHIVSVDNTRYMINFDNTLTRQQYPIKRTMVSHLLCMNSVSFYLTV